MISNKEISLLLLKALFASENKHISYAILLFFYSFHLPPSLYWLFLV